MEGIYGGGSGFPRALESADLQEKRLKGFEPSTFCMAMAKVTREPRPLIMPICGGFANPGKRDPDGK